MPEKYCPLKEKGIEFCEDHECVFYLKTMTQRDPEQCCAPHLNLSPEELRALAKKLPEQKKRREQEEAEEDY